MQSCSVCGVSIRPRSSPGGLPRKFCSQRCRQAAYRAREGFRWGEGARSSDRVGSIFPENASRPVEADAVEVLIQVQRVVGVLEEVSRRVPPSLRWRFAELAEVVDEGLSRLFGDGRG